MPKNNPQAYNDLGAQFDGMPEEFKQSVLEFAERNQGQFDKESTAVLEAYKQRNQPRDTGLSDKIATGLSAAGGLAASLGGESTIGRLGGFLHGVGSGFLNRREENFESSQESNLQQALKMIQLQSRDPLPGAIDLATGLQKTRQTERGLDIQGQRADAGDISAGASKTRADAELLFRQTQLQKAEGKTGRTGLFPGTNIPTSTINKLITVVMGGGSVDPTDQAILKLLGGEDAAPEQSQQSPLAPLLEAILKGSLGQGQPKEFGPQPAADLGASLTPATDGGAPLSPNDQRDLIELMRELKELQDGNSARAFR